MKTMLRYAVAGVVILAFSTASALTQSADDIIEKHLAASGGRAALGKLTSRTSAGAISLTTPVGELAGTIEVYAKVPNKSRTLITLDLSAVGGGRIVSDQRFDGAAGYVIDTFNGNREITGGQLEALRNGVFPTPLLGYGDAGATVAMAGSEKVGDTDAFVILLTPKAGPAVRLFIDVQTFMLVRTAMTIDVPQVGQDIEQVVEFSDFRAVDGVQVPYTIRSVNAFQTVVATMSEVSHNGAIDDTSFARPAGQ